MKQISEKEAVLRERAAYASACHKWLGGTTVQWAEVARDKYPMPQITRPRVIMVRSTTDGGTHRIKLAIVEDRLMFEYNASPDGLPRHDLVWEFQTGISLYTKSLLYFDIGVIMDAYVDLRANPTETVDE